MYLSPLNPYQYCLNISPTPHSCYFFPQDNLLLAITSLFLSHIKHLKLNQIYMNNCIWIALINILCFLTVLFAEGLVDSLINLTPFRKKKPKKPTNIKTSLVTALQN